MPRLVILGSASVLATWEHDNTHMVFEGGDGKAILVDCGSNPVVRLQRAGIHYEQLEDLILTHFHPDHVHGVPILLMHMWLIGANTGKVRPPLRVHGLEHCLKRAEDMMMGFSWDEWPEFFPLAFYRVPEREHMLVLDSDEFRITSSPTAHYVPTVGLRVEVKSSKLVVAYSCDTAPTDNVIRLAKDADILIHEATGTGPDRSAVKGHSSAEEAGEIAARAGAKRLILIHYRVWDNHDTSRMIPDAKSTFDGPVQLAEDFLEIDLSGPLPDEGPIGRSLFPEDRRR